MKKKNKNLTVHLFWLIVILIMFIIALISVKWGKIENLVNYILFGLSITSIVLAFLTIIYSIISYNKSSDSISGLNSVSNDIHKAALKITEITNKLNFKIEDIFPQLKMISDKTSHTQKLLTDMTEQGKKTEEIKEEFTEKKIKAFLGRISFNGLCILYFGEISMQKKKPIIFSYEEDFYLMKWEYAYGFLIASSAIGLIKYDMSEKDKTDQYNLTIQGINEILLKNLEKSIYSRAEKGDKSYNLDVTDEYSWVRMVKEIENYFN